MKTFSSTTKGFTLVETLVALSIFTLSIVGLVSATAGGLNNVTYSKNKITAMALSAEGIELVRNIRDTKAIPGLGDGWGEFLKNSGGGVGDCTSPAGCFIDSETLSVAGCPPNSCPYLQKYTNGSGAVYFGYQGGTNTPFARTIKISNVSSDEILITSTVSWGQGSGIKSVSTQEHLMNWLAVQAPPVTP